MVPAPAPGRSAPWHAPDAPGCPPGSDEKDGKIIYAGATSSPDGGSKWELARLTANGALDPTFGTGGIVTTEILAPAPTTVTFESPS